MEFTTRVDIDSPRDRVWAVVSDPMRWPEWMDQVKEVEPVTGGPAAYGSEYKVKAGWLNTYTAQIRSFREKEEIGHAGTTLDGTNTETHRLSDAPGGGTRVDFTVTMDDLWAKAAGLLAGNTYNSYVVASAANLKRLCEATA